MSMLHTFDTRPAAIVRDVVLVALIVALAIVATVIFSGGAQALSFSITPDPMGSYPW
jgi:hypothetical protein